MKASNLAAKISDFFVDYFSLNGQLVSQEQAEANIREGVSFRGTNILILILAILIASLGLNTNSTAVIIGAMLISPLMGPIIGIGLGVGIHDFELIKRCVRNLIMAAGFSVIASTIFFMISPVNEQHSELLARTSPTIYDVLIGFVGGGAGIIALGSTNKGNVIPGVAIATALMPPLCTAGYGLATWQLNYFFGAFYLFVINSIYIAFATFIGVKLMKYKGASADTARARRVRRVVYTLAVITMLPSIYLTYNMLRESRFTMDADRFIAHECDFPDTQVLGRKATFQHGKKYLTITLIGRVLPPDSLKAALDEKLRYYGLAGTDLSIIQGYDSEARSAIADASNSKEVYAMAQATISRQQAAIDSLQQLLYADRTSAIDAPAVAPEVKVLFPAIRDIAVATTVFVRPNDQSTDTANVAMIKVSGHFSSAERKKLAEYLGTRLNLSDVQIVEL